MPQFYPDGPASVSLNAIEEGGSINTPPQENFDTTAMQGSMQQLLSENLGRFVVADFLVGVSNIVRRVGVLYSVGRGFLVLYLDEYKAFQVCDIFSLKFITFFPPGHEPTLEEIISGYMNSGLLSPGGIGGVLRPSGTGTGGQINFDRTGQAGGMMSGGMMSGQAGGAQGGQSGGNYSSQPGCRTLRQR